MHAIQRTLSVVLMVVSVLAAVLLIVVLATPDPGESIIWWRVIAIAVVLVGLMAGSIALWRAGGKAKSLPAAQPAAPE